MGRLNKEDLVEMEKMLHSGSSAGDIASRFGITTQWLPLDKINH
jgi:hypothetical protein